MFCHHGYVEMSIHSLRFPLALRAIAIWLTQGVGSVIGIRTPLSSGFWSSSRNKLWSAVGIFLGKHVDVLDSLLMHLSSLIVINFNFCTVLSPSKHVSWFGTTMNLSWWFSLVRGLTTVRSASARGFMFVLFHMVGLHRSLRTWHWEIVFTSAALSSKNLTSQSFTLSTAVTSFTFSYTYNNF